MPIASAVDRFCAAQPQVSLRYTLVYRCCLLTAVVTLLAWPAKPTNGSSPAPVLTQHNDNGRTGAYLNETTLNTSNVNHSQFGKLFTRAVDGQIYAQPLYMPGLLISGAPHNVVFVATMHDSVYAFDADDPAAAAPLWQVSLGTSAPITYTIPNTTTTGHDFGPPGYHDILVEVGILSTPVIDTNTHTLYVVAFTKEPNPTICPCQYAYRLHAFDLNTGAEKFSGPVVIKGTMPGGASDGEGGLITFRSTQQLQRAGLLLQDGVVYIAFAGYSDWPPYHGWVFGYDAATLQPVSTWNSTPNAGLGGIWQSGQGLAADDNGKVYLITGNGGFDADSDDYGDSFIKLDPQGVVSAVPPVADSFTPFDQDYLSSQDLDLGLIGPMMIPGTHLLLGGGKTGKLYVLDRDDMGGYQQGPGGTDRVVQTLMTLPITPTVNDQRGAPIYWNSPSGPQLYHWGSGEALKAYSLTIDNAVSDTVQITLIATSTSSLPYDLPGAYLSLSADGSGAGTGIVWAVHPAIEAGLSAPQGVLHAFDAGNVGVELWNSIQFEARDAIGNFAKFTAPTVANGKVYVASFSNRMNVYGIMSAPWIIIQPVGQTIVGGHSASLSVVASGQWPLTYEWYQGLSGDTQSPVGTNSAAYITPPLGLPARFWVRVINGFGHIDSASVEIELANSIYLPLLGR